MGKKKKKESGRSKIKKEKMLKAWKEGGSVSMYGGRHLPEGVTKGLMREKPCTFAGKRKK